MKYFGVIFKRSFLYATVNALLILIILLTVSACNNSTTTSTTKPPGNILEFDDFPIGFGLKLRDVPTQIHVISSIDSPLPDVVLYVSPETQAELDALDFSQYFILCAFMGSQAFTGPTIEITQIWQTDNVIYIDANFNKGGPTYQPGWSSPKHIVKVSKENMTQFGEITFILLNQDGKERANAVYEINM